MGRGRVAKRERGGEVEGRGGEGGEGRGSLSGGGFTPFQ